MDFGYSLQNWNNFKTTLPAGFSKMGVKCEGLIASSHIHNYKAGAIDDAPCFVSIAHEYIQTCQFNLLSDMNEANCFWVIKLFPK